MENITIGKEFNFKALMVQKKLHAEYENNNPITKPMELVDQHTLVGIEVEVENMKNFVPEMPVYWQVKNDSSLRNSGLEFTSIPLRSNQVEHALDYLIKQITSTNVPVFSNRCSVHVHLNVRDFTINQLINLVIIYSLFEKHFFHIAGTKRESNIFCVPLYKTEPSFKLSNIRSALSSWHKYNALNLGTTIGSNNLPAYGTVEFRHLYGTLDKNILMDWINQILCVRKEALTWETKDLLAFVQTLNTTSEYVQFYQKVFGKYANLTKMAKYDFESCVTFLKRWEWGTDLHDKYHIFNPKSTYFKQLKQQEPTEKTLDDLINPMPLWIEQVTDGGVEIKSTTNNGKYPLKYSLTDLVLPAQRISNAGQYVFYRQANSHIIAIKMKLGDKYPVKVTTNNVHINANGFDQPENVNALDENDAVELPTPVQPTQTFWDMPAPQAITQGVQHKLKKIALTHAWNWPTGVNAVTQTAPTPVVAKKKPTKKKVNKKLGGQ